VVTERRIEHLARAAHALLDLGGADSDAWRVRVLYGTPARIRSLAASSDTRLELWDYGPSTPYLTFRRPATSEVRELTPEALEYREALFELGRLRLAQGRHEEAAARLREAVERYPEDPQIDMTRFHLAEALRLSARQMEETLREGMPLSQRRRIEQDQADRLAEAQRLYEAVRSRLERKPRDALTDLERLTLRNAYFYRADSAFDRGLFEDAIRLYDAAAQRYADEPASLVAMMQIVNSYITLERWPEARTANARARRRLEEIPDDALDAPDLPLDRRHWERWLESSERLTRRAEVDG